eukprot:g25269.t1
MMCAIRAGQRGRSVLVIDHARAPGEKIRISGGGRCNFTNLAASPSNYLSANPHFAKSALARYPAGKFIELVDRHRIPWHEKTLGQLFCDNSAKDIIRMLIDEMTAAGARLELQTGIAGVEKCSAGFRISTSRGEAIEAASVVVATGGKSIPKMGATGIAYDIARQFGLRLVETRPALVPLTLDPGMLERLSPLAGIAVPAIVRHAKTTFKEAILFTHRGLSGPSILQISSYWREGDEITLSLEPEQRIDDLLKTARKISGKQTVQTALAEILPKRLAQVLTDALPAGTRLADCSDRAIAGIAAAVQDWKLRPAGSEGYRTAEVTLGGVDTDCLDSRSMQAKNVAGLYFIGECVDVTGWLGGYNFQWAWSSGYVFVAVSAVAGLAYSYFRHDIMETAVEDTHTAVRTMGLLYETALPGSKATIVNGTLQKIAAGEGALKDHDLVDRTAGAINGVATVFEKQGGDYVRISTNVKTEKGERAIGTKLAMDHPAQAALAKGQAYFGPAVLFGRDFMTAYFPVTNSAGAISGVLFIGIPMEIYFAHMASSGKALAVTSLIALFGISLVSFFVIRSLVRPIGVLTGTVRAIATGDNSCAIPYLQRADEFGNIAQALQVFRDNALEKQRIEGRSAEERAQAEAERERNDHEKQRVDSQIDQAVTELGGALARLAQGDLSVTINHAFSGKLEQLRNDFNGSVVRLRDTLSHIRESTMAIQKSSADLSQSSTELSRRTETQAASLEETAAAVDEITATVRSSADRAREANQAVTHTKKSADSSGIVVKNAVEAMGRIEEASQKIELIIEVIDDIAFQTNLLALNAGIEAARAGEAGKGFAVVAQEVRELAQRSAGAAKEIKDLINQSTREVSAGASLVQQAGEVLATISQEITAISQHVETIATASQDQSAALQNINGSVNRMDQMTQQNGAMVGETSEASQRAGQATHMGVNEKGDEVFLHLDWYQLTADGASLFEQILEMEGAARRVESWKREGAGSPLVRIACGTWLAWMFSRNISALRTERDGFRLDFYIAERRANLAHRESDIGIRAFEPEEPNLAATRLGDVAYAAYRARSLHPSYADRWIAVAEEEAVSAYLRWPHEERREKIAITVNRARSLRDLVLGGAGTAVLPCVVGDQDLRLERVGGEIEALRHRQWIVMNNDDRHRREIRTVVDRIVKFIKGRTELFGGRRA